MVREPTAERLERASGQARRRAAAACSPRPAATWPGARRARASARLPRRSLRSRSTAPARSSRSASPAGAPTSGVEAREATLEEARALFFRSLGAAAWERRAVEELARIGGRAPATGELTPVERRVVELVAAGSTNREVAAALFLSTRTVEGHLSRVYGKLGVHSRVELVRKLAEEAGKVT